MVRKLLSYFISGLAIILPMVLTFWVIFYIISTLDSYLKLKSSMVVFLIVIVLITILGYIARRMTQQLFWKRVESALISLPIFGLIYKAVKDITTSLIGRDRKFSEPVLVKLHSDDVYKIGFITSKNVEALLGEDENNVSDYYLVYFPLSFSLSGDLFMVPKDRITYMKGKAKDVMQTVVSGGVIKTEIPR